MSDQSVNKNRKLVNVKTRFEPVTIQKRYLWTYTTILNLQLVWFNVRIKPEHLITYMFT